MYVRSPDAVTLETRILGFHPLRKDPIFFPAIPFGQQALDAKPSVPVAHVNLEVLPIHRDHLISVLALDHLELHLPAQVDVDDLTQIKNVALLVQRVVIRPGRKHKLLAVQAAADALLLFAEFPAVVLINFYPVMLSFVSTVSQRRRISSLSASIKAPAWLSACTR